MSRCIIVLGVPRSGTSLTAGILHHLGVYMGNLQKPDESNPNGYFEDLDFQKINKKITGLRYSLDDPQQIDGSICEEYRTLISKRESMFPIWGMKDPRLCVTLKWFSQFINDCKIIVVTRYPQDSAKSLEKHSQVAYNGQYKMSYTDAIDKIAMYQKKLIGTICQHADLEIQYVRYADLCKSPRQHVLGMVDFCFSGMSLYPDDKQIDNAIGSVGK